MFVVTTFTWAQTAHGKSLLGWSLFLLLRCISLAMVPIGGTAAFCEAEALGTWRNRQSVLGAIEGYRQALCNESVNKGGNDHKE